jgi:hypothetical protein
MGANRFRASMGCRVFTRREFLVHRDEQGDAERGAYGVSAL